MAMDDAAEGRKAEFGDVYNRSDPRAYFQALEPLEYQIPQHARRLFSTLLAARRDKSPSSQPSSLLDVCCSYGVNAALLRTDLTLQDLYARYGDPALAGLAPSELVAADRDFYAARTPPTAPRVVGLDVADRAVGYACDVGLLDAGWAENLEAGAPSAELADGVADAGMVTITGGVGYVTELTFDRLLSVFPASRKPWVAAFVLRMYPYDRIAQALAAHGLVTEQLTGTTFLQRRFASTEERDAAVRSVRERGVDTQGKEETGWYHCDFFLSRPQAETERQPLRELVG